MRYQRRYTQDLYVIEESDNAGDLCKDSDYLVHIWDTQAQCCIWQSGRSVRYGEIGFTAMRYTFETSYLPSFKDGWTRSSRRFDTANEACVAACEWLQVCIENGCFAAIRVVSAPQESA